MQKILNMVTKGADLRSPADAWSSEDGDEIDIRKEIGLSGGPKYKYEYANVMYAIADGWKLLAPPVQQEGWLEGYYSWWLTHDGLPMGPKQVNVKSMYPRKDGMNIDVTLSK